MDVLAEVHSDNAAGLDDSDDVHVSQVSERDIGLKPIINSFRASSTASSLTLMSSRTVSRTRRPTMILQNQCIRYIDNRQPVGISHEVCRP